MAKPPKQPQAAVRHTGLEPASQARVHQDVQVAAIRRRLPDTLAALGRARRGSPVVQLGPDRGRTLTVEDAGPPGGFPVLVHCGGGSRHLEPAALREARNHGLRLISYDRPSCGGSTPPWPRT